MKYKKKVVFFCPSIEEGGVEKNFINICNGLSKNFKISVVTANNDKKKKFNKDIEYISPKIKFFNKRSRVVKTIVCIYMIINNFLGKKFTIFSFQSNIIAIIISGILKNKIIIRSNSSPNFYAKNIIKRKIMSLFFGMADKIVVNSDDFEREFKKYFNLKSIRIYNLMEDQPRLKKLYNQKVKFNFFDKNKKSLKIVSIGRLVSQKDHITILKALNLIKEKKNFKFCIIGKGIEYNNLQKYIISNNLRNKVKLIGYKKNIYPFLKKADIFILSSLYEGLPNTLLEAVSTGIPIISSNCKTGPREILNKKKYGKLFKIRNYVALSKLIKKSKKKNYSKFINDHRFDFKKNLEKYKKVILSL